MPVPRDDNFVPGLLVLGSATGADVVVEGDETTKGINVQIVGDDVGIGGGTQYTEDAAAVANPVGNAIILVRADTPAGITSTDGDNVAQRGTDYGAAFVQVVDSSGTFIDTFGGGTQYAEGDTAATITGTAMMMEGAGNALVAAQGTAADGLLVNLGTNNDITLATLPDTAAGDLAAINLALAGTLAVSAASLPLPTGAATAANQLPDGHNVTIDNASGASAVNIQDGGNTITVDGTVAVSSITNALPAGTNAIGKLSANSGVDIGDVDVTSISAGSNLIGDIGIQGRATGGLSTYYDSDLDETAVAVKAGAGTIYAIEAFNTTDAPLFLQLFNVAQGSVTVGTTTPTNQWVIPGNADSDGAGFTFNVPQGIAYGTAITAACSTNSEGNTAPGAGACIVNIHFK